MLLGRLFVNVFVCFALETILCMCVCVVFSVCCLAYVFACSLSSWPYCI